jgi:hypothetical protein
MVAAIFPPQSKHLDTAHNVKSIQDTAANLGTPISYSHVLDRVISRAGSLEAHYHRCHTAEPQVKPHYGTPYFQKG